MLSNCCCFRSLLEFNTLPPHTYTDTSHSPFSCFSHHLPRVTYYTVKCWILLLLPVYLTLCLTCVFSRKQPEKSQLQRLDAAGFGRSLDVYGGGRGLMGRRLPGNEAPSTFVYQFCLLSPAAVTPTSSSTLVLPHLVALFLLLLLNPSPSYLLHIKEEKHMNTVVVSFRCGANITERRVLELLEGCSFKSPFDF